MAGDGERGEQAAPRQEEAALLARVREAGADLEVTEALRILRSPWMTSRVVDELLELPRLLHSSEVRRELAAHPRTVEVRARRLVPTLYWRDLVRLSRDTRVRPAIRRAAETSLSDRLPGLAVGEKMSIARSAGPGVIVRIRSDPSPRVIAALLENPRLTESMLAPLLSSETARPAVLTLVAHDRRWGVRYGVRLAICRNPRAPASTTLPLLPHLRKSDLRAVSIDPRLSAAVRRRARLLLGEA